MKYIKKILKKSTRVAPNVDEFKYKISQTTDKKEKARICYDYVKKYKSDLKFLGIILHQISNAAMLEDFIFAHYFIDLKGHKLIFDTAKTSTLKWLMYSCLWNLYRSGRNRDLITKQFFNKILKDFHNIKVLSPNPKLLKTYFGALSNMSLSDDFKDLVVNWFEKLTKEDFNSIYTRNMSSSLSGLICNCSMTTEQTTKILNSKFVLEYFDHLDFYNSKDMESFIKNNLAMINNLSDNIIFQYYFVKYRFIEKLRKIKIEMELIDLETEGGNFINNIENMLSFSLKKDTSFHKAIELNFKDLVFKWIDNKSMNVNHVNLSGETGLEIALEHNHKEIIRFLLLNGSKYTINSKNKSIIEESIKIKKKLDEEYCKTIQETFDNILGNTNYEKHLCSKVNSYIDKMNDIKILSNI